MTATVVMPELNYRKDGVILTFVVPAPSGCDLGCPFCFIRQRREDLAPINMKPNDYVTFISQIAEREPIAAICIQGYEPLLPNSFRYTREILAIGRELKIPTSLVTNGTHLEAFTDDLALLRPFRIAVSIDAADPDQHDRQRRKVGAWHATVNGLRAAEQKLHSTEIFATSVLLPKKRKQLDELPAFLSEIRVQHWVVTALMAIGKDKMIRPIGQYNSIIHDLTVLQAKAQASAIKLHVDDEFDGLMDMKKFTGKRFFRHDLRIRRLRRAAGVVRLIPSGHCSVGTGIMTRQNFHSNCWIPGKIEASDLIASLRSAS